MIKDILYPLKAVQFVNRDDLKPNDYNPNKILEANLKLLVESILSNGWTMPIVVRPDMTIIDGFHRWTVAGREPLKSKLNGIVPVVIVSHNNETDNMYGTITHNRARGTHLLEPMERIIKKLLNAGKTVKEISKQLGMRDEEIFRLSGLKRDDFLDMIIKTNKYSQAMLLRKL